MIDPNHPYLKSDVVLPTKHEKGRVVAPHFSKYLQMQVKEIFVDTDLLGTFSGEIERVGTAQDVVIKKALLGISSSGCPRALASEGSIGADPYIPFINSNIEFLSFVDVELSLKVIESMRTSDIVAHSTKIDSLTGIETFLAKADFPNHKLIVRSEEKPVSYCVKGISTMDELNKAISLGLNDFPTLKVENDLRAHCSPSRQKNISVVAEKLAMRLTNLCPECRAPGWGLIGYEKGLPCQECGTFSPTALAKEIHGCSRCGHKAMNKVLAESIDPAQCQLCNP